MKKIVTMILLLGLIVGCSNTGGKNMNNKPIATIDFKDLGEMKFELQLDNAPQSVANFTELANSGFYDGLEMHRIIDSFVAQGGDPDGNGTGGPGYSIKGEFSSNGVDNPTQHDLGALAFARSMHPDSAGSQFYIVTGNYDPMNMSRMNSDYAAFGTMLEGESIITEINNNYASGHGNPLQPLVINSVKVDTFDLDLPTVEKLPR